jgi:predicted ester cyclase
MEFVDNVNRRNLDAVGALMAPGFVAHWVGRPDVQGAEAWIATVEQILSAVSDLQYTVDAVSAEGDLVEMRGIPATGTRVRVEGMGFFQFNDGKLIEEWAVDDTMGLLQQLGVLPTGR